MVLTSGQTVSERVQACIGHTVRQPNGLGQIEGRPRQREVERSVAPRVEWHRPLIFPRTKPQSKYQKPEGVFIYSTSIQCTMYSKV